MRLVRNKFSILILLIMTTLCLVSAAIAIRVSIVMIEKKDKVIGPFDQKQDTPASKSVKMPTIGKLQEQVLYFNGELNEGETAFVGDDGNVFVAVDDILSKLGTRLNLYGADDLLDFSINGEKVLLKLGRNSFQLNKNEIGLDTPPAAAKNHILVPVELLTYLDGFTVDVFPEQKTVFINYYPDYLAAAEKLSFLRLTEGMVVISDISGQNLLWEREVSTAGTESLEPSPEGSSYLLKSDNNVYLIKNRSSTTPYIVNVPASAHWSADGKFLHWIDRDINISYIYDVEKGLVKKLGNYYHRAVLSDADEDRTYAGDILYDFKQGSKYKRVSLTTSEMTGNYTFIERKGKTVFQGNAIYSPDKTKILFKKEDSGFHVMNSDGTKEIIVGNGIDAKWVTNDIISLRNSNNEMFLYSCSDKETIQTDRQWNKVGETYRGDIFYVDGSNLHVVSPDGKDKLIMELPWTCDYIQAVNDEGPYIAVSKASNSVYYISGTHITNMGQFDYLSENKEQSNPDLFLRTSIAGSPDNEHAAFLFNEGGFVALKVIGQDDFEPKRVILNYSVEDNQTAEALTLKWISNSTVLVYSSHRGWIVDFTKNVQVRPWSEPEGSLLQAILLP